MIPMDEYLNESMNKMKGKKIVDVRYMNDQEIGILGWEKRAIIFFLDDGEYFFMSCDNEGNGPGALFFGEEGVLPIIEK